MRSLLQFISRFSNFLIFLLLEVVAFLIIIRHNDFQHSSTLSASNTLVAWQYDMLHTINSYFHLTSTNEELSFENAKLQTEIAYLQEQLNAQTALQLTQILDTQYQYIPARIVHMTTNDTKNYLIIDKGEKDGLKIGMGVRCVQGIVGIICTVGNHYSLVIPILNTALKVSCRLSKNNYVGILEWDGIHNRYAKLTDIASHIDVELGDTVVTSGLSPVFPRDILVGVIEDATLYEGDAYYSIKVKLATDFKCIDYVQIINHSAAEEQIELENNIQNGMD